MSAILGAAAEIVTSVTDLFTTNQKAKYDRLPDWLQAKDFRPEKDHTTTYVIIAMTVVFVTILIVGGVVLSRPPR